MNIWEWIKYSPKIIEEVSSFHNQKIKVVKASGEIYLEVDGLTQSGPVIERLWTAGFKNISFAPRNLLLLGVGAGSVFKIARNKWPAIKLTGIEIDSRMVDLAKVYYPQNLDKSNLIIGNAIQRIKKLPSNWDLILIDLYKGKKYPQEAETDQFLKEVKNHLSENGIAIFNRLYFAGNKNDANNFAKKLTKNFSKVYHHKNALIFPTNLLIFANKKF